MEQINTFESSFLVELYQKVGNPILDKIFTAISFLGNSGCFFILLALVLVIFKKTRKMGILMAVAMIFDLLIVNICIKPIVQRIRPYEWNAALVPVLSKLPTDFSFPSGHSAVAFAATGSIRRTDSRVYIAMLAISVAIAFSRLYVGVHYPTDVLAGVVIGSACGALSRLVVGKAEKFRKEKK